MKLILCILWLSFAMTFVYAYQNSFPSLFTPSGLYSGESELALGHRFYGAVDNEVWDTLFGINSGANVALAYRYNVMYNVEFKAGYNRADKQYELGVGIKMTPADFPMNAQVDLQYFSFVQPAIESRRDNLLYLLSLQSNKLLDRVSLVANVGFDGYYERLVNAWGLQVGITEKISLLGEYYPVWDRDSADPVVAQYLGNRDAYAMALKLDTYGHHFIFSLGNGTGMNPRVQSLGTNDEKLHFGFNIHRRLGQ